MYELLNNNEYQKLTIKQSKELIEFLSKNTNIFDLTANSKGIVFNPPLPNSIYEKFGQFILFTLTNYTLQSLVINENYITFEAGFGAENFGSTCKVSIESIFQISIENSILFLNPNATVDKDFFENVQENEQKKRSMNAFHFEKK